MELVGSLVATILTTHLQNLDNSIIWFIYYYFLN